MAALSVIVLNALILFIGIPEISSRLHSFYNQDEYADGYDQLATNLAHGHGYRMYPDTAETLSREPGYPVLLAGIFVLFGNKFVVVKAVNFILAIAGAWLMMLIARRISSSPFLIWGAPLLFLFHPGTLLAESRGGVEIVFAFLLLLFMWSVYAAIEKPNIWRFLLSGAVLGFTLLVRSTPLLFPGILLGYLLLVSKRGERLQTCWHVAAMVGAMFVVLSPWIVRNYRLTGKFVPTASVLGVSAHAGLYDNTHLAADENWALVDRDGARERRKLAENLGYAFKPVDNAYYQDFYKTGDELRFSSYLSNAVLHQYEENPALFLKNVELNMFNLWFRGKTAGSTEMNMMIQIPYLFLALIGAVLALSSRRIAPIAPMLLLIVYLVGIYVAILAQARYSVPLLPFLSILACEGLLELHRRFSGQTARYGLASVRS